MMISKKFKILLFLWFFSIFYILFETLYNGKTTYFYGMFISDLMTTDIFQATYLHSVITENAFKIVKQWFNEDRCEVLKDCKGNAKMVFIHLTDLTSFLKEKQKPRGLLPIVKHLRKYAKDNGVYMFCYHI